MKNVLNKLLTYNPSFLPGYIELAKTSAMVRNWDEINEISQKILLIQVIFHFLLNNIIFKNECIPAHLYEFIYTFLIQGDVLAAEKIATEISEYVLKDESTNLFLNYNLCKLFTSLMIDNSIILKIRR